MIDRSLSAGTYKKCRRAPKSVKRASRTVNQTEAREMKKFTPKTTFPQNDTSAPAPGLAAGVAPEIPPETPRVTRSGRNHPPGHSKSNHPYDSPLPQYHATKHRDHPGTRNCAGIFWEGLEFYFLCQVRGFLLKKTRFVILTMCSRFSTREERYRAIIFRELR